MQSAMLTGLPQLPETTVAAFGTPITANTHVIMGWFVTNLKKFQVQIIAKRFDLADNCQVQGAMGIIGKLCWSLGVFFHRLP